MKFSNFFWGFWGIHFQGQMLVFVGYISVSISLAALPPNLQGGATANETHIHNTSEQSVLFQKAGQS